MILQRILQEILKKDNTWNIRRLVDESFIPTIQRIILKIVGFQVASSFNGMLLKLGYLWLTAYESQGIIFFYPFFFLQLFNSTPMY